MKSHEPTAKEKRTRRLSYNRVMLERALKSAMRPAKGENSAKAKRAARAEYIDALPDDHPTKLRYAERSAYREMVRERMLLHKMNTDENAPDTIAARYEAAKTAMDLWHDASVAYKAALDKAERDKRSEPTLDLGVTEITGINEPLITKQRGDDK